MNFKFWETKQILWTLRIKLKIEVNDIDQIWHWSRLIKVLCQCQFYYSNSKEDSILLKILLWLEGWTLSFFFYSCFSLFSFCVSLNLNCFRSHNSLVWDHCKSCQCFLRNGLKSYTTVWACGERHYKNMIFKLNWSVAQIL